MRKILLIVFLTLLLFYSCGKKGVEVNLGREIEVIPQFPEDTLGFKFSWTFPDKPKESEITILNLNPNSKSPVVRFTPDIPGKYRLQLVMTNIEGKEVEKQEFIYDVVEASAGEEVPPVEEAKPATTQTKKPAGITGITDTAVSPAEKQMVPEPRMDLTKSFETRPEVSSESANRVPSVSGKYTIQVSSWNHLKDAEKEVQNLKKKGYDAFIQRAIIDGREYFRVRVGSFNGYSEAREALAKFKKSTGYDGWIDKMRKDM